MNKKVEVVPYDERWPEHFAKEAERIREALGDNCIEVHHVGSTAVPGLAAKPKLDIIPVVKNGDAAISSLEAIGHEFRGEFNIPFHWGFSKREGQGMNVHVYEEGNPEIELNLRFRNYLRNHPEARDAYAALKWKLLEDPASQEKQGMRFTGYNLGKDHFIKSILQKSGFNDLAMRFCTHREEWAVANQLANTDLNQLNNEQNLHFIFYKGVEIIGYAHVELKEKESFLNFLSLPEEFKAHFLPLCQKYLRKKGLTLNFN